MCRSAAQTPQVKDVFASTGMLGEGSVPVPRAELPIPELAMIGRIVPRPLVG